MIAKIAYDWQIMTSTVIFLIRHWRISDEVGAAICIYVIPNHYHATYEFVYFVLKSFTETLNITSIYCYIAIATNKKNLRLISKEHNSAVLMFISKDKTDNYMVLMKVSR